VVAAQELEGRFATLPARRRCVVFVGIGTVCADIPAMQNPAITGIESRFYLIRGHKVLLDSDLAFLYGVETKVLNQAVRRNITRFPEDTGIRSEEEALRSQIVTSKPGRGGRRYRTMVFTEFGVAMLSSILNSEHAIQVNIAIMRAFGRLREVLESNQELAKRLLEFESRCNEKVREGLKAIRDSCLWCCLNRPMVHSMKVV
jgi:hypothetical protein